MPAPSLEPGTHVEYVDNFVSVSRVQAVAHGMAMGVGALLEKAGLPVHETTLSFGGETLGWCFGDSGNVIGLALAPPGSCASACSA